MKVTKSMIDVMMDNLETAANVKKVFRQLSKELHPDKNGNSSESNEIQSYLTNKYHERLKIVEQQKSQFKDLMDDLDLDRSFVENHAEEIREMQREQQRADLKKVRSRNVKKAAAAIRSSLHDIWRDLIDADLDRGTFTFALNVKIDQDGMKVKEVKNRRSRNSSGSSSTKKYKVKYRFTLNGERQNVKKIAGEQLDDHDPNKGISAVSFLHKVGGWTFKNLKLGNVEAAEIDKQISPYKVEIEDK